MVSLITNFGQKFIKVCEKVLEIKKMCVYLPLQVEEVERLECTDIDTYIGTNITNTAFDTLDLSKDNIECG